MAHFKRGRPKQQRAGADRHGWCKPQKMPGNDRRTIAEQRADQRERYG